MKYWRVLTFNMRLGLIIFLIFGIGFPIFAFGLGASGVDAFFVSMIFLLATGAAFLITIMVVIDAMFRGSREHGPTTAIIADRISPLIGLVIGTLALLSFSKLLENRSRDQFAQANAEQLIGFPPKAVIYNEGIPDGGTAIVRSPNVNPEGFSSGLSYDLVQGNIQSCEPIDERDWFCNFG